MLDRFNIFVGRTVLALRDGVRRQDGQTLAEYALILGVIAVVTVATLIALGNGIHTKLQSICNAITSTVSAPGACS